MCARSWIIQLTVDGIKMYQEDSSVLRQTFIGADEPKVRDITPGDGSSHQMACGCSPGIDHGPASTRDLQPHGIHTSSLIVAGSHSPPSQHEPGTRDPQVPLQQSTTQRAAYW